MLLPYSSCNPKLDPKRNPSVVAVQLPLAGLHIVVDVQVLQLNTNPPNPCLLLSTYSSCSCVNTEMFDGMELVKALLDRSSRVSSVIWKRQLGMVPARFRLAKVSLRMRPAGLQDTRSSPHFTVGLRVLAHPSSSRGTIRLSVGGVQ